LHHNAFGDKDTLKDTIEDYKNIKISKWLPAQMLSSILIKEKIRQGLGKMHHRLSSINNHLAQLALYPTFYFH